MNGDLVQATVTLLVGNLLGFVAIWADKSTRRRISPLVRNVLAFPLFFVGGLGLYIGSRMFRHFTRTGQLHVAPVAHLVCANVVLSMFLSVAHYALINAVWFIFVSFYAVYAMQADKTRAERNQWRIPEFELKSISMFGGYLGLRVGMALWRHKTRQVKFQTDIRLRALVYPLLLVVAHLSARLITYLASQ